MFGLGITEMFIIGAILFLLAGVPLAIVVFVLVVAYRSTPPPHDSAIPEQSIPDSDNHR